MVQSSSSSSSSSSPTIVLATWASSGELAGGVSSVGHPWFPGGRQHWEVAFGGTAGQCFSLVDGSPAVWRGTGLEGRAVLRHWTAAPGARAAAGWGGKPLRLREAVVWFPTGVEASGVFVPAEARGTSSAVWASASCSGSHSPNIQLRRVRCSILHAPGSSVASNESPSATAGSTPLRPRLGVSRLQGRFSVETEGHSTSWGGSDTMRFGMEVRHAGAFFGRRCGSRWSTGLRAQATVQTGRTKSSCGAANVERWSRRPMSTSLVVDECLRAAVLRLNGLLASGYCFFSSTERRRTVLQCTLVGVSSVELLRGTDHGLGVVAASPVSHQFASFFLACCPVSLGWPAGEFLSFFKVSCTDIGLSGSKEANHRADQSTEMERHIRRWNNWWQGQQDLEAHYPTSTTWRIPLRKMMELLNGASCYLCFIVNTLKYRTGWSKCW